MRNILSMNIPSVQSAKLLGQKAKNKNKDNMHNVFKQSSSQIFAPWNFMTTYFRIFVEYEKRVYFSASRFNNHRTKSKLKNLCYPFSAKYSSKSLKM